MNRIDECLKFVLKWEGGFSDDPDDPGGATNCGIIQETYDKYRKGKSLPVQSVQKITKDECVEIYRKSYWNAVKADTIPAPLDLVMFDSGVNNGVRTSIKWLQTSVGAAADGDWGAKTDKAIAEYIEDHGALKLAQQVLNFRESRYRSLVVKNPKLKKFLKGWMNRINDLRKTVGIKTA